MIALDECIYKSVKKVERVGIKIMNQVLKDHKDWRPEDVYLANKNKLVKIQSERDIFPVAMFVIKKEDHQTLKERLAPINNVIKAFARASNPLKVAVLGCEAMRVEMHLQGDLKTLHCSVNVSHGVTAKQQNLFDTNLMSQRASDPKPGITRVDVTNAALSIPLERTHFCALHAEMRLVEKVLNMAIADVWLCVQKRGGGEEQRDDIIKRVETLLGRDMGLYGGHFELREDEARCKVDGQRAPHKKVSLNGTMSQKIVNDRDGHWYRSLVILLAASREERTSLLKVFEKLKTVVHYLRARHYSTAEQDAWQPLIDGFCADYRAHFGNNLELTRYMYLLQSVGKYFICHPSYGGLSLWSNQAFEKTHYVARTQFQRKTTKGGGRNRASAIMQIFELEFRKVYLARNVVCANEEVRALLDSLPDQSVGEYASCVAEVVKKQAEQNEAAEALSRAEVDEELYLSMYEQDELEGRFVDDDDDDD
jgi:hypothetical protein